MDGEKEKSDQRIMDAPGRKVQRKRKMIPKQRKPEDSLDCLIEDNLKVVIRPSKKAMQQHSSHMSHVVITELDCPVPCKPSGTRPLWGHADEDARHVKSKFPPIVCYKGKEMKLTEVINQVIFEVVQRVVREVAEGIVIDMMDKIVGKAIDAIFLEYMNKDKVEESDQANNDDNDDRFSIIGTIDEQNNIHDSSLTK